MATTLLSHTEYNSMLTIYEATAAVESFQATQDLMLFGDIFLKHLMHGAWGLSLVHRHFDLKPNEIMLELPVSPGANIITKAVDAGQVVEPLVGSNYYFHEGSKLQAFEYRYGSNATLQEPLQNERFSAFLSDLTRTIAEVGLSNVLGLAPVTSIRGLETTNYEERENIVKSLVDGAPIKENYMPTVWVFNEYGPSSPLGCVVRYYCAGTAPHHNEHWDHVNVPN
ncbi:hypothetical protein BC936DRAFT_148166 [Jimgerdemannia flammicorona]|uniref:Uncharacterized protein n=1 Tax=Jimgerdemannia flammicorona TaxID=994334 RepID=A0A433D3P5_9FUNG|nr:hypothetical protein BC936DRAFT_148166 [Jimgerdemannia flammicorona]